MILVSCSSPHVERQGLGLPWFELLSGEGARSVAHAGLEKLNWAWDSAVCGDQAAIVMAARRADTAAVLDAIVVFILSRLSPPKVRAQHLIRKLESQSKPFVIARLL